MLNKQKPPYRMVLILLSELADKLNNEEKSNTLIVLHTVFEDKSFKIEYIKSISLEVGGSRTDIADKIKDLIK